MKKLVLLVITLCLLIAQTACAGTPDAVEMPNPSEPAELQENETDPSDPTEPESSSSESQTVIYDPRAVTTIDKVQELAEQSDTCKLALAFLTGDIDTLANYDTGSNTQMLQPIKSLRFSSFALTADAIGTYNEQVSLAFTVSESDCAAFPVGAYSFTFEEGPITIWRDNKKPSVEEALSFSYQISCVLSPYCFSYSNGEPEEQDDERLFQIGLLRAILMTDRMIGSEEFGSGMTLEKTADVARELYGLENYVPSEEAYSIYNADSGKINSVHLGGDVVSERLTDVRPDADRVTFVYQMYADRMYLVPSHLVEYTFRKENNTFGWQLEKIECKKRGAYAPYRTGV